MTHPTQTRCCDGDPPTRPSPCCCGGSPSEPAGAQRGRPWVVGTVDAPTGPVPQVAPALTWADRLGALRVRLRIRRMHYMVDPGLYAVGRPDPESPVLVSANYKLSFDRLRQELGGLDAWILVLDTDGINVWCAAGKGTFGTDELVHRLEAAGLTQVVSHRTLIVPQLGAPGVAAHVVRRQSGFRVVYGPVRARDIPAFLHADRRASPDMRRVRFGLTDRLAVVPVELVQWATYALLLCAGLVLLAGLGRDGYDWARTWTHGLHAAGLVAAAYLGGTVVMPVLMPWLPGRAFAVKGATVGVLLAGGAIAMGWVSMAGTSGILHTAAWVLLMPVIASFLGMNFTGASTYTSRSGVEKEMRYALPVQVGLGVIGLGLWIAARLV